MKRLFFALNISLLFLAGFSCRQQDPPVRPNILWITAEDMSPVLGYLGDKYAITPNLDRLASESVIYTHAFATSPVCSPSRAALINGLMASTQGAHQMRSTSPLPDDWLGFPSRLRAAGYYTTNNEKTDYNSASAPAIIAASWNESSHTAGWRGRDTGQPFFSIFNLMISHQSCSMVWPYEQFQREAQSQLSPEEIHDPALAPVPPYYPDTPVIRQTIARFYDCVTVMDKQAGQILADLEADGLLDDTIVFFYSDHGSGMPRHKRVLLDSGMHVPLLVRFPEKYRYLAPAEAGSRLDRLVNFADFGPTVLSLTGVGVSDYMEGIPFLGEAADAPREYVFGHRDRVDEAVDMARSVRDRRYLYTRNYMPHLGYNQQSAWPDLGKINHEFYALDLDEMTDARRHFAGPARPLEELYDSQADPLSLHNLVDSPDHREILERMRAALRQHLMETRDLGFIPEIEMSKQSKDSTPYDWARSGRYDLAAHMEAAEAVGTDDAAKFQASLSSPLPGVRYWGAVGFSSMVELPADALPVLEAALKDDSEIVRIEAASALLMHGYTAESLATLVELLGHEDEIVVMYAARAIELGGEKSRPAYAAMKALNARYAGVEIDPGQFIKFTTQGFLNRVKE